MLHFSIHDTTLSSLYTNSPLYNLFAISAILYLPFLFLGQYLMRNRDPVRSIFGISITVYSFIWNMTIGIMSGIGAYYVIPGLNINFCSSLCYDNSLASLTTYIFCVTKMLEWIDTIFLILRKKKILFLHYFHHLTTMVYCWFALYNTLFDCSGMWFTGMNLFVHFIMYCYYGLTDLGFRSRHAYLITIIQTIQMVIGTIVSIIVLSCDGGYLSIRIMGLSMYMVYYYLFFQILKQKVKNE